MILRRSLLLGSLDGDNDGGDSTPAPQPPAPEPTPEPKPPTSAAKPPAATIVTEGKKSESDVLPEIKRKQLETRINDLEDENRQLKNLSAPPPPPAAPEKTSFLTGFPFD